MSLLLASGMLSALFLDPLPGAWNWWYLLLLPLTVGLSLVYKGVRCRDLATVPREAAETTLWILLGMAAAGALLVAIVKLAAHWG